MELDEMGVCCERAISWESSSISVVSVLFVLLDSTGEGYASNETGDNVVGEGMIGEAKAMLGIFTSEADSAREQFSGE